MHCLPHRDRLRAATKEPVQHKLTKEWSVQYRWGNWMGADSRQNNHNATDDALRVG